MHMLSKRRVTQEMRLNPVYLLLMLLIHLASGTDNQRNAEETYRLKRRHGVPGTEYSEYSDYDSKVNHPNRPTDWNNSPIASTSQTFSENRSNNNLQANAASSNLKLVPNWPDPSKKLGQVAAVDIDINGNVVVFHRGDRIWGSQTFAYNNIYTEKDSGPIQQNPVVVFHTTSGRVLEEWGNNLFYLPHGLTIDSENNIWITDVALHQVFKFSGNRSSDKPSLILGEPFVPGNDNNHFCKPTDVAVLRNGDFFVADGYCNSRIIKFDKTGKRLMEWGRSTLSGEVGKKPPPDHFLVPHALAIAEENSTLFVADRENGRIQCFNTSTGVYMTQLHSPIIGSRIFSIAYAPIHGGLLYIVNGPVIGDASVKVDGFVVSLMSERFVANFNSDDGFQNPHDVAVTKDGSEVYVVELNPFKIWKFVQGNLNITNLAVSPKIENASSLENITGAMKTALNSQAPSKAAAAAASASHTKIQKAPSSTSVAATVAAIASVIIVIISAVTVVILRIRRGSSKHYTELDMYYE